MANTYPEVASAEVAEIYFRGVKNLAERSLDDIFQLLGMPVDYDDWDLGRIVYYWRSARRCVRVHTRHDRVNAVHLVDPDATSRFGAALEVIFDNPDGK